jgi:hypothetical protein
VTDWLERGMNSATPQAEYRSFILEYFLQHGVSLSEVAGGLPNVPNPYLYNNGADFMDARQGMVSPEQWQADRTNGVNAALADFWNANYCALQVPLAKDYGTAVQIEGAPFRAAYDDGMIRGAMMRGLEEINEAVPDNPVLDVLGMGWLTSWKRYQYASENSYAQADDYFNEAAYGGRCSLGPPRLRSSPARSSAPRCGRQPMKRQRRNPPVEWA